MVLRRQLSEDSVTHAMREFGVLDEDGDLITFAERP